MRNFSVLRFEHYPEVEMNNFPGLEEIERFAIIGKASRSIWNRARQFNRASDVWDMYISDNKVNLDDYKEIETMLKKKRTSVEEISNILKNVYIGHICHKSPEDTILKHSKPTPEIAFIGAEIYVGTNCPNSYNQIIAYRVNEKKFNDTKLTYDDKDWSMMEYKDMLDDIPNELIRVALKVKNGVYLQTIKEWREFFKKKAKSRVNVNGIKAELEKYMCDKYTDGKLALWGEFREANLGAKFYYNNYSTDDYFEAKYKSYVDLEAEEKASEIYWHLRGEERGDRVI